MEPLTPITSDEITTEKTSAPTEASSPVRRTYSNNNKKKPVTVTMTAALVACLITFIVGFVISSAVMSNSKLDEANSKNAKLQAEISRMEAEIETLNDTIDEKIADNIKLGESIQEKLAENESLAAGIIPVETPEEPQTPSAPASSPITSFSKLTSSQQLIILILLFVVFIFIVSITCSVIAKSSSSKEKAPKESKKKGKKSKKSKKDSLSDETDGIIEPLETESEESSESSSDSLPEDASSEEAVQVSESSDAIVDEAIDLLYHSNLEDSIADLGGFRFGITNFEEVLSDKAKGKSFGNAENGDFVAFMAVKASVKKLFIIPRYMTLSDSSVALRGTTDLFDISDEAGNTITHGTVKIKTIDSPAVFSFGDGGWAIETKGHITASGTRH